MPYIRGALFAYFFAALGMYYNMKRKRTVRIIIIVAAAVMALLLLWEKKAEKDAHFTPPYPMEDLNPFLEKDILTKEDYTLLFWQTGLGKAAVSELWEKKRQQELLNIQRFFFKEVSVKCEYNTIISREESLCLQGMEKGMAIPVAEEGDILITFNCHVYGWRVGHAGLVVNAENGQVLEARVLGSDSAILSLSHWQEYPSFALLRLKDAAPEERKRIAESAKERLLGVPYRLSAGIWGDKGTYCSRLVWSAFWHFGYDLDSDGGKIVTPTDLFHSPLLEVVQMYGMNPADFLDKYERSVKSMNSFGRGLK